MGWQTSTTDETDTNVDPDSGLTFFGNVISLNPDELVHIQFSVAFDVSSDNTRWDFVVQSRNDGTNWDDQPVGGVSVFLNGAAPAVTKRVSIFIQGPKEIRVGRTGDGATALDDLTMKYLKNGLDL